MYSPYNDLPAQAFWRNGVLKSDPSAMYEIYSKKFEILHSDPIATAGSCFAQHIARHLRNTGYTVLDMEPSPPGMSLNGAKLYGYGLYSSRYGNIYTARQLLQLLGEVSGSFIPQNTVWTKDGRYYDALRPSLEPKGLDSIDEVVAHRKYHIRQVKGMLWRTKVFIFTLGLTEAWCHKQSGTVYPTAPGTIAGIYDEDLYEFKNFCVDDILRDMRECFLLFRNYSADVKFILTVSPVPLTATATGNHVLRASMYSKSVLRVAAETLASEFDNVDYFPSFEIINNPAARMEFFESNLREVSFDGVYSVMKVFSNAHKTQESDIQPLQRESELLDCTDGENNVLCDEALLDAFATRGVR